jgi:hypothetical protein
MEEKCTLLRKKMNFMNLLMECCKKDMQVANKNKLVVEIYRVYCMNQSNLLMNLRDSFMYWGIFEKRIREYFGDDEFPIAFLID